MTKFKANDIVRNKHSKEPGTVDRVNPPGMPGYLIVRYHDKNGNPSGDGLCTLPAQIELVSQ